MLTIAQVTVGVGGDIDKNGHGGCAPGAPTLRRSKINNKIVEIGTVLSDFGVPAKLKRGRGRNRRAGKYEETGHVKPNGELNRVP